MALRIRLMRFGKKHQSSFRVIVKEQRSPRQGEYLEQLGIYNPKTDPETVQLNETRIAHWLSVGAKPTETVERLIKKYTKVLTDDGGAKGTKPTSSSGRVAKALADAGNKASQNTPQFQEVS